MHTGEALQTANCPKWHQPPRAESRIHGHRLAMGAQWTDWPHRHPKTDLSPGARTTRCASSASLAPASQCFILWHQMCQRLSQTVTSSSGDPESQALTPAGVRQLLAKAPLRHIWQKHKQASVSSPEKWGSNSIFPGTDMWTKWDKD